MTRPPKSYWLLPAAIAGLRLLPFLATFWLAPPPQQAFLHVGYMPEDMHAYLSFIRQVEDRGAFLFDNAYVTADQSGRFVLLFHWLLGAAAAVSGVAPNWALELSRVPLLFLFFAVLWWFLEPVAPERRERTRAAVLVGLSGGVDVLLRPFADLLPGEAGPALLSETWPLYGWTTFEGFYNPLWTAGVVLLLAVLRRFLAPADDGRAGPDWLAGALLVALFFVHPYSALVGFAVAVARPIAQLLLEGVVEWRRLGRQGAVLGAAAALILLVSLWQSADPVFKASSGGVFGRQQLALFWYPLTLGLLLPLALRGGTIWIEGRHRFRSSLVAWIGTVMLLHTSPLLNGYHFVLYLHLPVSILAAAALPDLRRLAERAGRSKRLAELLLALLIFASPLLVTLEALRDLRQRHLVPRAFVGMSAELGRRPAGNALVPPQMGLLVPVDGPHRVWAGHWFLTPDYWPRVERYAGLVGDPSRLAELESLIDSERIRYLVVPAQVADRLAVELDPRVEERLGLSGLELLVLRAPALAGER